MPLRFFPRLVTLAVVISLASVTALRAQVEQGRYFVGLNGGFTLQFSEESDATYRLSLTPSVLKLFTDDLALGGRVNLAVSNEFFDDGVYLAYGISPAARYYFTEGDGGRFFAAASAGVTGLTVEEVSAAFTGNLGVGYTLFLNEGLAIEPGLDVTYFARDGFNAVSFSLGIGLQGFVDSLLPKRDGD